MPNVGFSDLYFWLGVTLLYGLVLVYLGFDVWKFVSLIIPPPVPENLEDEDAPAEPVQPKRPFPKGKLIRIVVVLVLLVCGGIVLGAAQRGKKESLQEYGSYVEKELKKAPPKSIEQVNQATQEKLAKEAETDREKIQKTSEKQVKDIGETMSTFRKTIIERDKEAP